MRLLFALFVLLWVVACQSTLPSSTNEPPLWNSINLNLPPHATVLALAVNPTNARTLYAATYDNVALYRSDDAGGTWRVDNNQLPRAPVFALLPIQAEIFAATADGLYRHAWNADYWQRADPVPQVAIYGLVGDDTGALYAATDGRGIWKSDDGGTTWSRVPGLDDESLLSVLPLDSTTVFVGTGGHGMFVTRDGGKTWSNVAAFASGYITLILRDPHHPTMIYARARNGLYRSTDYGESWQELTGGIEREIVNALWFDETRILIGTASGNIYFSDDAGTSWRSATLENPRHRALLTLFRVGKTDYAGTFDGLLLSGDNGETWSSAGQGLGAPIVHDMALDAAHTRLLVATEDGLFERRGDGEFTRLDFPVNDLPVSAIAIAPNSPQRIYIGTDGKGVFVSDDGGKTWSAAVGELGGKTRVSGLYVDPTDAEKVYARVLFARVYKSSNGGADWRAIWTGMPDEEQVQSIVIDSKNLQRLYAGGDAQLFYSDNGGEKWLARGLQELSTLALWIDPENTQRIWAGTTDGLYQSDDAGESWRGPLLKGVTIASMVREDSGNFYVGTKYNGVYISQDGGKTFAAYGLEGVSVDQLALDASRHRVYARTPQGLYELGY
ncbi:MAG TPA: hypothetical protein VFD70_25925 [Anaerolineae bacterium]|nr:hypothetical protein [Anaerolineae bacterium]